MCNLLDYSEEVIDYSYSDWDPHFRMSVIDSIITSIANKPGNKELNDWWDGGLYVDGFKPIVRNIEIGMLK